MARNPIKATYAPGPSKVHGYNAETRPVDALVRSRGPGAGIQDMQLKASPKHSRDSTWERPLVFSSFLLTGVTAALLGPLIPELEAAWGIDHAQSGSLFLVQFASSSVAAVISNFNLRRSLIAGYALSAVALLGIAWGGWPLARGVMVISGFSLGLVISGSNLLVAEKNPDGRGAALATLNLIWGLGAVASPLLLAAFLEPFGAFALLEVLAVASAGTSLALAVVVRNPPREAADPSSNRPSAPAPAPLLALIGALFFFYVGTEISVGGWLVSLAAEFSTGPSLVSLVIGSGFWAAVLIGRATAVMALRRLGETSVYSVSLSIAAVGLATLLLAGSQAAVAAGAVLAGLGLAPLFPLTVSILTAATASNRAWVPGLLLACGGLGGSLLPWLTGRLSRASTDGGQVLEASLSRGFLVPIAGLVALASLFFVYLQRTRVAQAASAPDRRSP